MNHHHHHHHDWCTQADGSLRCLGSQLHLKNKFGQGYHLKLSLQPQSLPAGVADTRQEDIDGFVTNVVNEQAVAVQDFHPTPNQMTYSLPKEAGVKVRRPVALLWMRRRVWRASGRGSMPSAELNEGSEDEGR